MTLAKSGWRRIWIAALAVLAVGLVAPIAIPALFYFTYNPNACRDYTRSDVDRYVRHNAKPGLSVCGMQKPEKWDNNNDPYKVSMCNKRGEVAVRAEVYPDCDLEWRTP